MKVFKFSKNGKSFTIASANKDDARNHLMQEYGVEIKNCFEIPSYKWGQKEIKMYVDNDINNKMFHVSINELIPSDGVMLLATTDNKLLKYNTLND